MSALTNITRFSSAFGQRLLALVGLPGTSLAALVTTRLLGRSKLRFVERHGAVATGQDTGK